MNFFFLITKIRVFDFKKLKTPKGTREQKYKLNYEDVKKIVMQMKRQFQDSAYTGIEKDEGLKSSIGAIYQTFDGKDLYKSVEEKAAHLLYFVIKDHPFVDGNKRIASFLFAYFLPYFLQVASLIIGTCLKLLLICSS